MEVKMIQDKILFFDSFIESVFEGMQSLIITFFENNDIYLLKMLARMYVFIASLTTTTPKDIDESEKTRFQNKLDFTKKTHGCAHYGDVTTSRRSPAWTSSSRSASDAVPEEISWDVRDERAEEEERVLGETRRLALTEHIGAPVAAEQQRGDRVDQLVGDRAARRLEVAEARREPAVEQVTVRGGAPGAALAREPLRRGALHGLAAARRSRRSRDASRSARPRPWTRRRRGRAAPPSGTAPRPRARAATLRSPIVRRELGQPGANQRRNVDRFGHGAQHRCSGSSRLRGF